MRVLCLVYASNRAEELVVGLALRVRALVPQVQVCAPPDSAETRASEALVATSGMAAGGRR